ncbi:phage regulatory CII family protein, partial [Halomonas sp. BBD48]|nr:phage regulatory CII family protein [Halomonas sp. BBD48]
HVLANQLNPVNDRHISLAKYYLMVRLTQDVRCVQPLLDELGMIAVPASQPGEDVSLFDLVMNHQVSVGVVAKTVRDALADGQIDAKERGQIEQVVQEEINALCDLSAVLKEMSQPREVKR